MPRRSPTRSSSTPAPSPPRPSGRRARRSAAPHRERPERAHRRHRLRGADRARCLGRAARRGARARQCREAARGKLDAPDAGSAVSDIMAARETAAHLVTEFAGRARAFVQVQQGCDHRCTFCIIPFGRGPSRSVPVGAIVAQVRALVDARLSRGGADRRRYHQLRRRSAGTADARARWCAGCWRWCRSCRGCGSPRSIRRRSTTICGG